MIAVLRLRLAESLRALGDVFTNPNLRRLELAWAGSIMGQWAFSIALAVFAYERGGATAVGVVALIKTIPAALVAPFSSLLGDRFRRERIMLLADLSRAALIGGTSALFFAGVTQWAIYALAGAAAVCTTTFGPAEKSVLPSLARTPEELMAANVASSTIESVGSFAGPAIGGLLLVVTRPGTVFAITAGAFLWSAFLVAKVRSPRVARSAAAEAAGIVQEAAAGFRAIMLERRLRVLVLLYAAQTLVAGALSVLVVVTAFKLLHRGESGVGALNSAVGVGGLAGALVALLLVGRRRLATSFGFGILLWGVPLALIGVWPNTATALVLLAVLGVGNTLVDVAGLTLLQRTTPDEVLTRVFGVLESMLQATIGLGAILAPLLIAGLGARTALIVTGAFLPVITALLWRRLTDVDAGARVPGPELDLLRSIPIFAPLSPVTLEQLAARVVPVAFESGEVIFRQGDHGDRFFVVETGEVEVLVDGQRTRTLGAGDFFGEIALLRDVPRTATVRALTGVTGYALEREDFLGAVTSSAPSTRAADAVIGARLGATQPQPAPA